VKVERAASAGCSGSCCADGAGCSAGTLASYVTELAPGSRCFCCGMRLVSAGRRTSGELLCPECGVGIDEAEDEEVISRAA
jgi:hypothetical protein